MESSQTSAVGHSPLLEALTHRAREVQPVTDTRDSETEREKPQKFHFAFSPKTLTIPKLARVFEIFSKVEDEVPQPRILHPFVLGSI